MRSQRLTRSLIDRVLGGVCGGLAAYIGVGPWWVRAVFVVLGVFTAGTGILLYLVLWLTLPAQTLEDLEDLSDRRTRTAPRPETVILIGALVIAMGLILLARSLGMLDGANGDVFLSVMLLAFGLVLALKQLWRRTA
ncbi:MAG TPA: PspC domain-containing protein [Aggregatilinea sp.]|uniref:PspC domain-containing protein n=1 Tax=Aggregatilinea sp. TaxID=2806333 RepID=UPI002C6AFA60|nr:PspC domain-containing protein [Aggregatilinea sp.]HML20025.1 PspC domain-containing protein [Aggregatilinea sp.]